MAEGEFISPGDSEKRGPRDLSRGKRTVTGRNSFKTRVKREKQELGIRNCGAAAGGQLESVRLCRTPKFLILNSSFTKEGTI